MKKEQIIREIYSKIADNIDQRLSYHGLHHTIDVHNVCKAYVNYYNLSKEDAELLEIAAAGHDIGFLETYRNHEEVGAEIISKMMKKHKYNKKQIETVKKLILATKIPQNPQNLLEQIICDADLDYLGRNDFVSTGLTLKKEWETFDIFPNLDSEFDNIQIGFLKSHHYHTDFAISNREKTKQEHLAKLENKQLQAA